MKLKLLSVLMAMILVCSMMPFSAYAAPADGQGAVRSGFTDMPKDWSSGALESAVSKGFLSGYGNQIMPKGHVTRAQLAAILNRIFGATAEVNLDAYRDVSKNTWYYPDMAKAVGMKSLSGNQQLLYPDRKITREEVFVTLARIMKISGGDESQLNAFADRSSVSAWAKDAAASLTAAGYIKGLNGKLNPKAYITRAEIAQLLDQIFKNVISKSGTYTLNNDGNVIINVPDVILKNTKVTGDLIVGDGVGNGDVTLDGVTVTGRMVIRGGGVNSIKVVNHSNLPSIIIARVDGQVRVYNEDGSSIGNIKVDGNDDVILEGDIGSVSILASDIHVTVSQGKIPSMLISGEKTTLSVPEGSRVENILVSGKNTQIDGAGQVDKVEAKADSLSVNTQQTKIIVSEDVKDVTARDKQISETYTTQGDSESSTYQLTAAAKPDTAGAVSKSGSYSSGTHVALSANVKSGQKYRFVNWTLGGNVVSTSAAFDYIMPASDVTLVANFIPTDAVPVASAADLYHVSDDTTAKYVQVADIDLKNSSYNQGSGWKPIGAYTDRFRGTYDGNGYTISNLQINREKSDDAGLFGVVDHAQLTNITLKGIRIAACNQVGALAGACYGGSISGCESEGSVKGSCRVGGLVGLNEGGIITQSRTRGNVTGNFVTGGLVGDNTGGATVSKSDSYAGVSGYNFTGTLVGKNAGSVQECKAYGNVTARSIDIQSPTVQAARASCFSGLYEAIGRNPEKAETMINTAIKLTGEAGDMSSAEVQAARAESFSTLYEAIARQPEAANTMINAAIKLTGEMGDMSSAEVQAARLRALSGLYRAISRQPEATDMVTNAAIRLTGEAGNLSSAAVQAARAESFSTLYEAIARQPEAADTLINAAIKLTGEAGDMSSAEVQAARAESFSTLYEGIARQPEARDMLINTAIKLTGEMGDMSSAEVQAARAESFSTLYEAIARQPEAADTLINAAIKLTGEMGDTSSAEVQAARAESFSTLYEAISRQPEAADTLINAAIKLTGEMGDMSSAEVQAARMRGFSGLYTAISRQPEAADMLTNAAIKLTGEAGNLSSAEVQAARAESFSTLYDAIARQPEAADMLTNAAIKLTGELRDLSSSELQIARAASFGSLYLAAARRPEMKTTLVNTAKKLTGEKCEWLSPETEAARMQGFDKVFTALVSTSCSVDELIALTEDMTGKYEDWTSLNIQNGGLVGLNTGTIQ